MSQDPKKYGKQDSFNPNANHGQNQQKSQQWGKTPNIPTAGGGKMPGARPDANGGLGGGFGNQQPMRPNAKKDNKDKHR